MARGVSALLATSLFSAVTSVTPKTLYYAHDCSRKGQYLGKKGPRRMSFDGAESRAEISAPQFGDNRIPPLHTILGVTVRYNT